MKVINQPGAQGVIFSRFLTSKQAQQADRNLYQLHDCDKNDQVHDLEVEYVGYDLLQGFVGPFGEKRGLTSRNN